MASMSIHCYPLSTFYGKDVKSIAALLFSVSTKSQSHKYLGCNSWKSREDIFFSSHILCNTSTIPKCVQHLLFEYWYLYGTKAWLIIIYIQNSFKSLIFYITKEKIQLTPTIPNFFFALHAFQRVEQIFNNYDGIQRNEKLFHFPNYNYKEGLHNFKK